MRTIRAVSNDRQLVKANETMDIYAPLAAEWEFNQLEMSWRT